MQKEIVKRKKKIFDLKDDINTLCISTIAESNVKACRYSQFVELVTECNENEQNEIIQR